MSYYLGGPLDNDAFYKDGLDIPTTYPWTLSAWSKPVDGTTTGKIDIGQLSNLHHARIGSNSNRARCGCVSTSGTAWVSATQDQDVDSWQNTIGLGISGDNRWVFKNNGFAAQSTLFRNALGFTRLVVGAEYYGSFGTWMKGYLAEIAIWNIALVADDRALIVDGINPTLIQPDNLKVYLSLRDDYVEIISGLTMNVVGDPVWSADHPNVDLLPIAAGPMIQVI